MAGHSKWANIKHRKGRADAKKGKIFSRLAKEIISAVKVGGNSDPKSNPRLRLALQKARECNLPNDIIDRNIKKATNTDQADYHELTYELYGYGGVGIILEVMTDNKNRFASDVRIATNKRGGTVAASGSVLFNFDRKGILQISKKKISEDTLFLAATEANADDFEVEEEVFILTTEPTNLHHLKEAIQQLGIACDEDSIELLPKALVECDEEALKANLALIEWLEGIEDVDALYHNMSVPAEKS